MQPLEAGEPQNIGDYRLLGRLGSGGMGRVYLGRTAGGRTVAVKVVHPHFAQDEEFRARFRREVAAARKVGGAWTAPVLDADPEAPVPWVATGYVAGPSLTQAVAGHGPLPDSSVRVLGAGLAEALTAVHALGLVHRDVKPSNVLLTLDGPRLIDFGIARATDATASLTSTGVSVGSPGYMSPEQILGKGVTPAADVFSLGAVLAFAATGTSPFPGDSAAALLYKVVHEEPELSGLHGDLRDLVLSCLAKSAAERPTPREVGERLLPGGAAAAVRAGWLPGELVAEAGRSAVRLLELEAASGPVPFTRGASAPEEFGPAPTSSGDSEDGDPVQRSRRRSCTVVLAVAGALAGVTLGIAFLPPLLGEEKPSQDSGRGSGQPSSSAPRAPGGGVPDGFLGTWSGSITEAATDQPHGTATITLVRGGKGEDVLRSTYELMGYKCHGVGRLESATADKVVVVDRPDPARPSTPLLCSGESSELVLTRNPDGTLQYTSPSAKQGKPYGTLRKR
ncbi:serine/threonine-protein kinase [Streptomyces cremeus]|uniref:Serine/threonine-protein kinase n=1 Tax=Streptomyces cremeus TaxID=66881 RepID=A0ABV5PGH1_STRCM